ncbi:MAG: citramalate synthase [Myxococcota bacterium]|nr:citramalate synthase [Myxococcota bacterium]
MSAADPGAVRIYDTTLRDGTQREGLSLTCDDKLRIAERLDRLGVAFVEAGWPGSNPKDAELFARAQDRPLRSARWVAFGATRRAHVKAAYDPQVDALIDAGTELVTIFGKSSIAHVRDVLRVTPGENLRMIEDTVAHLVSAGRTVVYDAEHFFDGWREEESYALETLTAARAGGAAELVLCDTNGGSMPWDVEAVVARIARAFECPIGIHAHDDAGLAVANSLAAVRGGARHVQGTINGWGERCGNADLCTVIPDLELKLGMRCLPEGSLAALCEAAREIAEIANIAPDPHRPYVGRSAFAHKGGVHVAAIRRAPRSYEHVDPARVGNRSRVVVSELAGQGNVRSHAEQIGMELEDEEARSVVRAIKADEARGCSFDAAEASVAVRIARARPDHVPPFRVLEYRVIVGRDRAGAPTAEATVKVEIDGRVVHTAGEHEGPVAALDRALRAALEPALPAVARIRLADFKVRILDARLAAEAITRVLVDMSDGTSEWSTVGASSSVVEASLEALVDGIEHGLSLAGREPTWEPRAAGGEGR